MSWPSKAGATKFLLAGQLVLTPDFVLRNQETARKIYVEVVAIWTPEYLEEKRRRLELFRDFGTGEWLLLFPKNTSEKMCQMLQQATLPMLELSKRSGPTDWIAAAQSAREQPSKCKSPLTPPRKRGEG